MPSVDIAADAPAPRGYTPNEFARLARVSADKVRAWIRSGELGAIDTATARCGRPRFVILPEHATAFAHRRSAAQQKPRPRRKRRVVKDYYPD